MVSKVWANYVVSVLLLIAFIGIFFTGVFKFLSVYGLISLNVKNLPWFTINRIHDFSGISLAVLALVHIILNWNFLVVMTKKLFGR